jgi:hypothetical protein
VRSEYFPDSSKLRAVSAEIKWSDNRELLL